MRNINSLVFDLCDTILRRADDVDLESIEHYIKELDDDELTTLNLYSSAVNKQTIRAIVQSKVFMYIDTYRDDNTGSSPFDFDTGRNYQEYVAGFVTTYQAHNNSAQLPRVFTYVFEYIKEASEYYRFFEKFYKLREDDVTQRIDRIIDAAAEKAAKDAAEKAAKDAAEKAAKDAAEEAENSARIAKEKASLAADTASEAAKSAVELAVNKKINEVTKTISETSVTILGIFAGIVLTVVAGLFYSSSVLDNVASTSIYKLVAVASIVGLVCFDLLAVMFQYIERIRNQTSEQPKFSKFIVGINICLVIIMFAFVILNYIFPEQIKTEDEVVKAEVSITSEKDKELNCVEPAIEIETKDGY